MSANKNFYFDITEIRQTAEAPKEVGDITTQVTAVKTSLNTATASLIKKDRANQLTRPILSTINTVRPFDLTKKQYVDNSVNTALANREYLPIGTIIKGSGSIEGFLKCDGSSVGRDIYPRLCEQIGRLYTKVSSYYTSTMVRNTLVGGGRPWQNQCMFNNMEKSDFENLNWEYVGVNNNYFRYADYVIVYRRLIAIGGTDRDGTAVRLMVKANIRSDDTIDTFTFSADRIPNTLYKQPSIVYNGSIYVFGGRTATGVSPSVYKGFISPDGSVSNWTRPVNMPRAMHGLIIFATSRHIYMVGGAGSTVANSLNVYRYPIGSGGNLYSHELYGTIPRGIIDGYVFNDENTIYMAGGYYVIGNAKIPNDYVYYYRLDEHGEPLTRNPERMVVIDDNLAIFNRTSCGVVNTSKCVYLIGGESPNGTPLSDAVTITLHPNNPATTIASATRKTINFLVKPCVRMVPIILGKYIYLYTDSTDSLVNGDIYRARLPAGKVQTNIDSVLAYHILSATDHINSLSEVDEPPGTHSVYQEQEMYFNLPDKTNVADITNGNYDYIKY